jgi:hypothetical protein
MPPNNQYNNLPQESLNQHASSSKTTKSFVKVALMYSLLAILFVSLLVFGFWSFSQMQDYKNNSDKKSEAAVTKAIEQDRKVQEEKFNEKEKSPYKTYTTPSQYGSVKVVYPKTWSSYVVEQNGTSNPVDSYFYPDFVPGVNANNTTSYILRLQVSGNQYKNELTKYDSLAKLGKVKVSPYIPEGIAGATAGVRVQGQIDTNKKGAMIIVPLRDKVLKIWTENEAAIGDFNNIVLKNLSYSP